MSYLINKISSLINEPSSKFKEILNPQQRWSKHQKIVKQNPQLVTVIVEKAPSSKLKMNKVFLQFGMNKNTTINELRQNIRKVLEIHQVQSITLFCEGVVPMASQKIGNLLKFQQPDGWIYFYISEHEAFGAF